MNFSSAWLFEVEASQLVKRNIVYGDVIRPSAQRVIWSWETMDFDLENLCSILSEQVFPWRKAGVLYGMVTNLSWYMGFLSILSLWLSLSCNPETPVSLYTGLNSSHTYQLRLKIAVVISVPLSTWFQVYNQILSNELTRVWGQKKVQF